MRLSKAAGTAVRFEPGSSKRVTLVRIAGKKIITGGNTLANGPYDPSRTDEIVRSLVRKGFSHLSEPSVGLGSEVTMEREEYAKMFGPTVGDRVRLGDTGLWVEIERDACAPNLYGEECKFGGGKTIRDGMAQASGLPASAVLDLVITNAVIIDHSGIYKADIGVKNGLIRGIGKAGNPDTQDGVAKDMIIGGATEVIAGEKCIVTAGAVDAHVHFICPQLVQEGMASGAQLDLFSSTSFSSIHLCVGITTFIGGGTGPSAGTSATTCTPSPFYMQHMLASVDTLPGNFLFTGKTYLNSV